MIRRAFNDGGYVERATRGELSLTIVWDREVDSQRSGEPPGTRSQIVIYTDGADAVAMVHRYLRPDGTLGGSGRPDPKVLVLENGHVIRVSA